MKGKDAQSIVRLQRKEGPSEIRLSDNYYSTRTAYSDFYVDGIFVHMLSKNCETEEELQLEVEKMQRILRKFPNAINGFVDIIRT